MPATRSIYLRLLWRNFYWNYPEWWSLVLATVAWLFMLAPFSSGHHHHGRSAFSATANWLLMTVAMMFPLLRQPIRYAAFHSLWPRRHRAILGFLAGYLALWLLAGLPLILLPAALPPWAAPVAFLTAALWQLTPAKRQALVACHRTSPLAPCGWSATRDCLRYGWFLGTRCLGTCAALMVACALTGHTPFAMILAGGIVFFERDTPRPRPLLSTGLLAGYACWLAVSSSV